MARRVSEPLLTCEAVPAEPAFRLCDAALLLESVRSGLVQPAFMSVDHWKRVAELTVRYRDRQPDLADLCLIRMSELYPRHTVIPTDITDFRVYPHNRREVIPLLCPPGRL